MAADLKFDGLDAVLVKLRTLGPKLRTKAMRGAGTKAMRVVRDAARSGARQIDNPESAANIAKNITTRYDSKGSKRVGGMVVKVGVVGGGRLSKDPLNTGHWRFHEFGSETVRAQPFMRPALDTNTQQVTDVFVAEMDKAIDKIIASGAA